MKKYFIKYRLFLFFLAKFLLSYLLLTFIYQQYLNQYDETKFQIDGFTRIVANHSKWVLQLLGHDTVLYPHIKEASFKVYLDGHYIVRIIEGCNAISVMILFVAFVIAFSGKFLKTILFIISGLILIHVLNVLRIALLSLGLMNYPDYGHILHDVVFPLFIYGVVFGLWVIWINKFSFYAKKNPKS